MGGISGFAKWRRRGNNLGTKAQVTAHGRSTHSDSLAVKPRESRGLDLSSTFCGLRSQCTRCSECMCRSASATSNSVSKTDCEGEQTAVLGGRSRYVGNHAIKHGLERASGPPCSGYDYQPARKTGSTTIRKPLVCSVSRPINKQSRLTLKLIASMGLRLAFGSVEDACSQSEAHMWHQ